MPNTLTTTCPGPCNNTWRRAEEIGEPHTIQPSPGEPVHCWTCHCAARNQLDELPQLFKAIYLEGEEGTATKLVGTIGRVGMQAPAWPGQQARLFADGLAEGILILANDVRELLDEPVENGTTTSAATSRALTTLRQHLRWLLAEHPCATESHGGRSGNPAWQIHTWHRSAEAFCKLDEQRPAERIAACPWCRDPWMRSRDGIVECTRPGCQRVMSNDEYADHVMRLHDAAKYAGIAA